MDKITRETITVPMDDVLRQCGPVIKAIHASKAVEHINAELKKIRDEAKQKIDRIFARVGVSFTEQFDASLAESKISLTFQNFEPSEE